MFHMYQRQKRKEVEPTLEDDDELDAVDAFKTCHTSCKTGLTEQAQRAVVSPSICGFQFLEFEFKKCIAFNI